MEIYISGAIVTVGYSNTSFYVSCRHEPIYVVTELSPSLQPGGSYT